ncbi:MAG: hypothetical protein JWQ96_2341 [Segetibacter sp.]|nr:hypothetical protein [Segetibacter sp.]
MRSKIFIALVATAITMSSCDWFSLKKSSSPTGFSIEGKWQVDSIKPGIDSSATIGVIALSMLGKDCAGVNYPQYDFKHDTVVMKFGKDVIDTSWFKLDTASKQLSLKEDTTLKTYSFTSISDSAFSITDTDSSIIYLKKIGK